MVSVAVAVAPPTSLATVTHTAAGPEAVHSAPTQSYVSAVVSIADVADAIGDRDAAYEALASGWVTAGDVLGAEAAKHLFEPRLLALRETWGDAAFLLVRDAYNDRRRAVLRGTT